MWRGSEVVDQRLSVPEGTGDDRRWASRKYEAKPVVVVYLAELAADIMSVELLQQ